MAMMLMHRKKATTKVNNESSRQYLTKSIEVLEYVIKYSDLIRYVLFICIT